MPHAQNTKKVIVIPQKKRSMLAYIKASVDSKLFQQFYCSVDGKPLNVLRGGKLSCAFYVTSVLKIFSLIGDIQLTVHRALDDLQASGWYEITTPKPGCIVVWAEEQNRSNTGADYKKYYVGKHKHIGFFLGGGKAISNIGEKRVPTITPLRYRPVAFYLWHDLLNID